MSGAEESGSGHDGLTLPTTAVTSTHSNTSAWVMSSANQHGAASSDAVVLPAKDPRIDSNKEMEYYSDTESCDSDASYDTAFFYEEEGVMLWHFECSYIDSRKTFNQTKGIRYDWCTPKQLKRFVRDRMLPDPYPKGVTLKYYYLRILERADKIPRFELLDLPPELRLMVYRKLLLFNSATTQIQMDEIGQVYPQILQTCTLINEEATRVLYGENTFVAEVRGKMGQYRFGTAVSARYHNLHSFGPPSESLFLRIPKSIDDFPAYLRRISCLHIHLVLQGRSMAVGSGTGTCEITQIKPLNHFLFALASFLMDGHRIRHLHLEFELGDDVNATHYRAICYPLQRLRNIKMVTLSGDAPKNIAKVLSNAFKRHATAINSMRLWQVMTDEAATQMAIHRQMRDNCMCEFNDCECENCLNGVEFRVFDLDDVRDEACFSTTREEETLACLARLRYALNKVHVSMVKESVQKMVKQRNARRAYETGTTCYKLNNAADKWELGCDTPAIEDSVTEDWEKDGRSILVQSRM